MGGRRGVRQGLVGVLLAVALVALSGPGGSGVAPERVASAAPAVASMARPAVGGEPSAWLAAEVAPATEAAAVLPQGQTVKVGDVGASSAVGLYLAFERGYFAEQGLNIDFVRFDSGAGTVAPLSVGELDAAVGVVSAGLFNAINRGLELRIVSPQSRYELGYSQLILNVRKDLADSGAIRDYADLRGRTAAVLSLGSTNELVYERALRRGGLGPSDANIIPLGATDQISAFSNRAIDVGLLTEPQATLAAERGTSVKWREGAEFSPGTQVSMVLYGPNYISRNPEQGQRFMVAYLKGVRDYANAVMANRGGRDAVVDALVKHTPLRDRELYERILWVFIDPNLAINDDDLRATIQWHVERGLIDRPTDLGQAVDRRFVEHALRVVGPQP